MPLKNKQKALGVEFQDNLFKLVEIEMVKNRIHLRNYLLEEIPTGWISEGNINQPAELSKWITHLLKKKKIKAKAVHLAINSHNVVLRPIQTLKLSDKLLRKAVETEIQNNISLPFTDYIYDLVKLPSHQQDEFAKESNEQEVMLVIAPKSYVNSYVHLLEKAKLEVLSVDLSPLCILRLMEKEREQTIDQTVMVINISEREVETSIFNKQILRLSRMVPLNARNYLELSPEVSDAPESTNLNIDVVSYANDLVREMERILNFYLYTLNNRDQQLSEIMIVSNLNGAAQIATSLQNYFQVPVQIEEMKFLGIDKEELAQRFQNDALKLVVPLGAAMKDVSAS